MRIGIDTETTGLPGKGHPVYITQLAHTRLVGQVTRPDAISGGVDVLAMQQRSIGAKPSIFATNPEVTPVSGASGFAMRRVPAGTTCASLR